MIWVFRCNGKDACHFTWDSVSSLACSDGDPERVTPVLVTPDPLDGKQL